jgi:hypothetical protein
MARYRVVLTLDPPTAVAVDAEYVDFKPEISRAVVFSNSRHEVVALFSDWLYLKKE